MRKTSRGLVNVLNEVGRRDPGRELEVDTELQQGGVAHVPLRVGVARMQPIEYIPVLP